MGWYTVTKTINGRQYLYLQMTYREGRKVKTRNKYLGPASGGFGSGTPSDLPTAPRKAGKPSGGLKIEPIKRMRDLSKKQQRAYMKESMRKIKKDVQRADQEVRDYYEWKHGDKGE